MPFTPSPTGTFGEITGTLTNANIINQATTGLTDIAQIAAQIQAGNAYVNVHTSTFPGGKIRGQLAVVAAAPEPASLLRFGAGMIVLAWRKRAVKKPV